MRKFAAQPMPVYYHCLDCHAKYAVKTSESLADARCPKCNGQRRECMEDTVRIKRIGKERTR